MKKIISIGVALLMLFSMCSISAFAADPEPKTADVYVTISKAGSLVVTQEKITVTDKNNDGKLDIDETLFAAHEAKYDGKAAAGYDSDPNTDPLAGIVLKKLWGNNSGNFGYYVNNSSARSLADEVEDGDYVYAFVYKDTVNWDKYCYFDKNTAIATQDGEITLTLSTTAYPEPDYSPTVLPIKDATITLNGVATTVKTNAEGKATVKLPDAGKVVISATSTTDTLVPPVVTATVNAKAPVENTPSETPTTPDEEIKSPQTGDNSNTLLFVILLSVSAMGIVICSAKLKRKADEK